jgi:hypothetical protein
LSKNELVIVMLTLGFWFMCAGVVCGPGYRELLG